MYLATLPTDPPPITHALIMYLFFNLLPTWQHISCELYRCDEDSILTI